MGLEFSISENVTESLREIASRADDLPMQDISDILLQSVRENFLAQGRPDPWTPRVDNPYDDGHPLLMDTMALYNSLYADVTADEVEINSGEDYGEYLDQGTSKMVARPFFIIQEEDADRIEDLLAQHLDMAD
jgi:phage gpG-like protein